MRYKGRRTRRLPNKKELTRLLGKVCSVPATKGISADFASYESKYGDNQKKYFQNFNWLAKTTNLFTDAYYEPGETHAMHWLRSNRAGQLAIARQFTEQYRDGDIGKANASYPSNPPKWLLFEFRIESPSFAANYLVNFNRRDLLAAGKLVTTTCVYQTNPSFAQIGDINWQYLSGRILSNALKSLTTAIFLRIPPVGTPDFAPVSNYKTYLDNLIGYIAGLQDSDGGIRPNNADYNSHCQPFQMGLLAYNLASANELVYGNANATILNIIKGLTECCYLWIIDRGADAHSGGQYVGTQDSFYYMDNPGFTYGLPGLGGFHYPSAYYLYHMTGDELWKRRGDQVVKCEMDNAPFFNNKEFHQQYMHSQSSIWYRQSTPLATPIVPVSTVDPTMGVVGTTVTFTGGTWSNNPTGWTKTIYRQTRSLNHTLRHPVVATNSGSGNLVYTRVAADVGFRLFGVEQTTNASGTSLKVRSLDTAVLS